MRAFIVGKVKGLAFEVLEYDPATHRAVLRGVDGIHTDSNFVPYMVKRVYTMTHDEPDCLKGKSDA
jgi:hypothetical protein